MTFHSFNFLNRSAKSDKKLIHKENNYCLKKLTKERVG